MNALMILLLIGQIHFTQPVVFEKPVTFHQGIAFDDAMIDSAVVVGGKLYYYMGDSANIYITPYEIKEVKKISVKLAAFYLVICFLMGVAIGVMIRP